MVILLVMGRDQLVPVVRSLKGVTGVACWNVLETHEPSSAARDEFSAG